MIIKVQKEERKEQKQVLQEVQQVIAQVQRENRRLLQEVLKTLVILGRALDQKAGVLRRQNIVHLISESIVIVYHLHLLPTLSVRSLTKVNIRTNLIIQGLGHDLMSEITIQIHYIRKLTNLVKIK